MFDFEYNRMKYKYVPVDLPNVVAELEESDAGHKIEYLGKLKDVIPELAVEFPNREFVARLYYRNSEDTLLLYTFAIVEKSQHIGSIGYDYRTHEFYIASPAINKELLSRDRMRTKNVDTFKKLFRRKLRVETDAEKCVALCNRVKQEIENNHRHIAFVCGNISKELLLNGDLAPLIIEHFGDKVNPDYMKFFEKIRGYHKASEVVGRANAHVVRVNADSTYTMVNTETLEAITCKPELLPAYMRRKLGMLKLKGKSHVLECGSFETDITGQVFFITEDEHEI